MADRCELDPFEMKLVQEALLSYQQETLSQAKFSRDYWDVHRFYALRLQAIERLLDKVRSTLSEGR